MPTAAIVLAGLAVAAWIVAVLDRSFQKERGDRLLHRAAWLCGFIECAACERRYIRSFEPRPHSHPHTLRVRMALWLGLAYCDVEPHE